MKRQWRITLGILNIIVSAGMLAAFGFSIYAISQQSWATWISILSLPFLVVMVFTSIGGIFTLKGRHWAWSFIGLVLAFVALLYFLLLMLYIATAY
jgi:hypothetical protein